MAAKASPQAWPFYVLAVCVLLAAFFRSSVFGMCNGFMLGVDFVSHCRRQIYQTPTNVTLFKGLVRGSIHNLRMVLTTASRNGNLKDAW